MTVCCCICHSFWDPSSQNLHDSSWLFCLMRYLLALSAIHVLAKYAEIFRRQYHYQIWIRRRIMCGNAATEGVLAQATVSRSMQIVPVGYRLSICRFDRFWQSFRGFEKPEKDPIRIPKTSIRTHWIFRIPCPPWKLFAAHSVRFQAQFWSPRFFAQYNMFNGYFYTTLGESSFNRFLTDTKKLLVVADPPFGGLITPIGQELMELKNEFENAWNDFYDYEKGIYGKGHRTCEILFVSPYFMESKICGVMEGMTMLDYKVRFEHCWNE